MRKKEFASQKPQTDKGICELKYHNLSEVPCPQAALGTQPWFRREQRSLGRRCWNGRRRRRRRRQPSSVIHACRHLSNSSSSFLLGLWLLFSILASNGNLGLFGCAPRCPFH